MNTLLWVLQVLAALLYGASGVMKVFMFDKVSGDDRHGQLGPHRSAEPFRRYGAWKRRTRRCDQLRARLRRDAMARTAKPAPNSSTVLGSGTVLD